MYYWTFLQKGKEELAKQVFVAMREFSVKSDWYSQVKEDLITCDIKLSEEEISTPRSKNASISDYKSAHYQTKAN